MSYATPIDTITNITKIVKCKRPHDNIIINEYSYICNRYNVKIGIDYHTDNTMKFTVEGIELDVLNATINIYELIKISMEIFPKGNSNSIFRNKPPMLSANKNHRIRENNISMEISPKENKPPMLSANKNHRIRENNISMEIFPKRSKPLILRPNNNNKITENKNTLKKCAYYENIDTLKKCAYYENIDTLKKCVYHDAEVYN